MEYAFEEGQFYGEYHEQDGWHPYSGIYAVYLYTGLNSEARHKFVHVARYLEPEKKWVATYMGQVVTLSYTSASLCMRRINFDFNQISIGI